MRFGHLRLAISAVIAVAMAWGCVLVAPALRAQAGFVEPQADFQVDLNLVVLSVSVTDHSGRFMRNLPEKVFRVSENGVPQKIALFHSEDTPVAVGLVVDNSGSMRTKLRHVVAAANTFVGSSNPLDQMFVVHFNEHVSLAFPAGVGFTSDPEQLKAAMMQITARGQTALYDAIAEALDHIQKSPLQRKVLIVISDGGDNASKRRLPQILGMLQKSNVIVYTVGLFDEEDHDRNPGVLKQMAQMSGGEAFLPHDIPDVTSVLQSVSRDIRNQYTIGYESSQPAEDGTYRAVKVSIQAPHAQQWNVRTRTGYIAAPPKSETQKTGAQ